MASATDSEKAGGERVEKGDLVEFGFEGTSDGVVFEKSVKPVLVFAGAGQVVKGLDDALVGARVGKDATVGLSAGKAFGERNPDMVRVVPADQFRRNGVNPVPGLPIEVDGMTAKVQSVSGGRVRIDFNHELAGKDVTYRFKVEKRFSEPSQQLDAIAKSMVGAIETGLDKGVATIVVPSTVAKDGAYTSRKVQLVGMVLAFVDGAFKVVVQEEYAKPVAKDAHHAGPEKAGGSNKA